MRWKGGSRVPLLHTQRFPSSATCRREPPTVTHGFSQRCDPGSCCSPPGGELKPSRKSFQEGPELWPCGLGQGLRRGTLASFPFPVFHEVGSPAPSSRSPAGGAPRPALAAVNPPVLVPCSAWSLVSSEARRPSCVSAPSRCERARCRPEPPRTALPHPVSRAAFVRSLRGFPWARERRSLVNARLPGDTRRKAPTPRSQLTRLPPAGPRAGRGEVGSERTGAPAPFLLLHRFHPLRTGPVPRATPASARPAVWNPVLPRSRAVPAPRGFPRRSPAGLSFLRRRGCAQHASSITHHASHPSRPSVLWGGQNTSGSRWVLWGSLDPGPRLGRAPLSTLPTPRLGKPRRSGGTPPARPLTHGPGASGAHLLPGGHAEGGPGVCGGAGAGAQAEHGAGAAAEPDAGGGARRQTPPGGERSGAQAARLAGSCWDAVWTGSARRAAGRALCSLLRALQSTERHRAVPGEDAARVLLPRVRSLSAVGSRVLSIESFGAFQGKRAPPPHAHTSAHARTCNHTPAQPPTHNPRHTHSY